MKAFPRSSLCRGFAVFLVLLLACQSEFSLAQSDGTRADRFASARASYLAGDYAAARAVLEALLPGLEETGISDTEKGEVYLFLGAALEKLKEKELAVANFCRARALLGEGIGCEGLDIGALQFYQEPCPPPLTPAVLERDVFSKPFFDRRGLIVAEEGGRLVGFAHAGFGPAPDGSRISTEVGAIHVVRVATHDDREQIAHRLLEHSEAYLTGSGSRTLLAGCARPAHGFYLGLYGGTESPGVLESDAATLALFRSAGYGEVENHVILQRPRAVFRPPVDRRQVQIRRQYRVESQTDPPPATWWEACTLGQLDRVSYRLFSRHADEACGEVLAWNRARAPGDFGAPAARLRTARRRCAAPARPRSGGRVPSR